MPRKKLKISTKVEWLSILDETGKVDASLDPKLDADTLLRFYRLMLTTRRADERIITLQRQGRMGTYGPCQGQEASHVAAGLLLRKDDWLIPSYRELGALLARGWPLVRYLQFWGGFEEGNEVPEGVNDLPLCVPVATQCLHAVGIAWAQQYRDTDNVAICFNGDGGTSEGDFHEAMNFAGVYDLPLVFIINNNQYAISHPCARQTRSETLAHKAVAYGFDGLRIDGNDILACHVAITEALEKARRGDGPTLIEALTYRLTVHTTADDPTKYREDSEVDEWRPREPLVRFEKYLRQREILDDQLAEELETDITALIKAAVAEYEAYKDADPMDAFRYVYEELPAELVTQRAEYQAALKREGS